MAYLRGKSIDVWEAIGSFGMEFNSSWDGI